MNKEKILSALAVLIEDGSKILHFIEDDGVSLIGKESSDKELFFPEFKQMKDLGLIRYEETSNSQADKYVITRKGRMFLKAEQNIKELLTC